MAFEETDEYKEIYKMVPWYGWNEKMRSQIAFVLLKVPEPVRNFACQQCIFITIHDGHAGSCVEVAVPPWGFIHHKVYIIQLSERIPCGHSFRYRRYSESLLILHRA